MFYFLDFNMIEKDVRSPAIIRLTATQIKNSQGYLVLGDYIKGLHDVDLAYLLRAGNSLISDKPVLSELGDITLLTAMLYQACTGETVEKEDLEKIVSIFLCCISAESLLRRGMVTVEHSKMDFNFGITMNEFVKLKPEFTQNPTQE